MVTRAEAPWTGQHPGRDRGVSAVEVVFAVPVMLAFILVLVTFGQITSGRAAVDGAARDAARAGSLERSTGAAQQAAEQTAAAELGSVCSSTPAVSAGTLQRGEPFTVTVRCTVPSFNLFGNLFHADVEGTSAAPADIYRRTEDGGS